MIGVRLKGRLGNQLFIYAFARALQERTRQEVLIYDRKDELDTMWHSHLDRYVLSPSVRFTSKKIEVMRMTLTGKLLFFFDRIYSRKHNSHEVNEYQLRHWERNVRNGLLLLTYGYHPLPDEIPEDIFCDGYFQSARFIDDIRSKLIQEFTPKEEPSPDESEWLKKIESTNSVCITIRLGDYIGNSIHQVCTKDFYQDAMHKMRELHPNCTFFVFSDEVDKAAQILDFPYAVHFDSGRSQDAMSLYIMSHCKHFIISNSSFSWWAQYLGDAPNKTVIAPDRWYANDTVCEIMQDSWIRLKC